MCAKFGCGPTVVSEKKGGEYRQTDRQTKKTAALYSRYHMYLLSKKTRITQKVVKLISIVVLIKMSKTFKMIEKQ